MTIDVSRVMLLCVFLGLIFWESVRPCKALHYGLSKSRFSHGAINLFYGFLGSVVSYVIFIPAWHIAEQYSGAQGLGLVNLVPMPVIAKACAAVLLLDLWTYWWHRMNHRIKFLWRFHRMHHSDPCMDATSAQRFHPAEIALSSMLRIAVILISGVELWHIALYDVVMLSVVLFHHSNIEVPLGADRMLRVVIPTPVMHKIHHSRIQRETDSNYGALFSIWDRVFGSFRLAAGWKDVSFGLNGYDGPESQGVVGLMMTPFKTLKPEGLK